MDEITAAMVSGYITAVTAALAAAGLNPVGPEGKPPALVETDEGYAYSATICVPDPATDRPDRRDGYALLWNLDEGWVIAGWTYDGRCRISMHTDMRLGPVEGPETIARAMAATLESGSFDAGRGPSAAELLAKYDPTAMEITAAVLDSIARRCERAASAISEYSVMGDLSPEGEAALAGWPRRWEADEHHRLQMLAAVKKHAVWCRVEASRIEREAANLRWLPGTSVTD